MLQKESVIISSLVFVLLLLLVLDFSWIKNAYLREKQNVELRMVSIVNTPSIQNEIQQQNDLFFNEKREITTELLNASERRWRSFWDTLLLKNELAGVVYEFKILSQSTFSSKPNIAFFETLGYAKQLGTDEYTSIKSFVFSDMKKDIFAYSSGKRSYEIIFAYKHSSMLIWRRILLVIILSIITLCTTIVAFFFSLISLKKQKHFEQLKTDFLNGMTHELNTPIAVIQLATQYLQKRQEKEKDPFLKETTDVILYETKRMSRLVSSILAVARLRQKQFKLDKEEISIHALLREAIDVFSLHLKSVPHQLDIRFTANTDTILGDKFHLLHTFSNLIDNAIKYRNKAEKLSLSICTHTSNDHICIEIKDNGIGIEEVQLKKIFDKFVRGENSTKDVAMGFGLGLAYVRDVIFLHKGTLKVDSTAGKGTSFTICLSLHTTNHTKG